MEQDSRSTLNIERSRMDVDIVCVGFGPAMGGFLSTLAKKIISPDGTVAFQSRRAPGMPLQIVCYERADDPGFGVSGVVTRARSIRKTFTDSELASIPMATAVTEEKMVYLLDPVGASRRSRVVRFADSTIRLFRKTLPYSKEALVLPWIPSFLHKKEGMIFSIGQFMQWVCAQAQSTGVVQVWPGTPAASPIIENNSVAGVRLLDQGVDKSGKPADGFMPGMDIHADLTVIGDGPVGPIGRQIDEHFGVPQGHSKEDWAVGMKMVVDLPQNTPLKPGTVIHTFGYPEPEIFGFMYVHPERIASFGIFVPSWFDSPVRTAYRYLQYWMLHPYLWQYLEGATLRSWGAKSLQESGRRGAPYLVGNGYARIGEGSGSTNVLTGSGVDEAWETGVLLAEAVIELLEKNLPFTKENLEKTYVKRRSESWLEKEGKIAEKARDGFHCGFVSGLIGMGLTGLTKGLMNMPCKPRPTHKRVRSIEEYFRGKIASDELQKIKEDCIKRGVSLHGAVMEKAGWFPIPYDGKLLVSHQDALLIGGKVQAPQGYADHVVFLYPELCKECGTKICIEMCSGQTIAPGEDGTPVFDREKCVHCGACIWNCVKTIPGDPEKTNIVFNAGTGGLHSAEN